MKRRKLLMVAGCCLLAICSITGCKPSKKKIVSSTYYKELRKEKEKLEKENKQLKKEVEAQDEPSADEKRAEDYLDKIMRDRLIKLEIGYADNMDGSEFVENTAAFAMATAIAKRADLTVKYTPEEVEEKFGPGYEYILYDEDNAIYEIFVYGGNYVVFTDLPNNVYYAQNASVLGEAFLHYKDGYPDSTLLHRLADAALIIDGADICYENDTASAAAILINNMDKTKSSRKEARQEWKEDTGKKKNFVPKSSAYTFYHHGNTMRLTVYDKYIRIENMDGKKTWFRTEKEAVDELKAVFDAAKKRFTQDRKEAAGVKNQEKKEQSHSAEIQQESDLGDSVE